MATRLRRRDSSGHMDRYHSRRQRYEAVLRVFGLAESFAGMKRWMQDGFLREKFPDPVLEFDSTCPNDADFMALRKTLDKAFAESSFAIKGTKLGVRDYVAVVSSLAMLIENSCHQWDLPKEIHKFMGDAGYLFSTVRDVAREEAWMSYFWDVVCPLQAISRLDTRLFNASLKLTHDEEGRPQVRMIISAEKAQERSITLDGAARPAYRVGTGNEWDGVRWLAWDAQVWGQMRQTGTQEAHPVYAQSHALRQLRERINLPSAAKTLQQWLYLSLMKPNIVEEAGNGDWLVEYRIQEDRVGYVIVTPLKDEGIAVVRTFLFLTMAGTPEARMLKKRLKLKRPDVEWLRLDHLDAFTQTDLRDDPVLRPLMEECGCGHLFELAKWDDAAFAPQPKPLAEEMKRYLRMAA